MGEPNSPGKKILAKRKSEARRIKIFPICLDQDAWGFILIICKIHKIAESLSLIVGLLSHFLLSVFAVCQGSVQPKKFRIIGRAIFKVEI
jgi:hypothetical protein